MPKIHQTLRMQFWFSLFLLGAALRTPIQAQLIIKLATITPDNSPWNDTLYAAGEQVEKLTEGRIRLRIYGNGLAGEENEVLRKIRLGSVDAGVFTAISLKSVVPETLVLSLPYFIKNEESLQRVLDELTPSFNTSFAENGYEILGWAFSGWIYMFYKDNIRSPSQVSNVRLGVGPTEPELQAAWRAVGFRVTTVSFSDTFISLQNGILTGFHASPIGALAYQWFAFTPYMVDSKIAPLLGAILISKRSWRRVSPGDQAIIRNEINKMIKEFSNVAREQDARALALMKKNGLEVYKP
ncbi:MAG: TRAP transporter substrate-binding protein DctP, partial [Spirochaetota bacterium]